MFIYVGRDISLRSDMSNKLIVAMFLEFLKGYPMRSESRLLLLLKEIHKIKQNISPCFGLPATMRSVGGALTEWFGREDTAALRDCRHCCNCGSGQGTVTPDYQLLRRKVIYGGS